MTKRNICTSILAAFALASSAAPRTAAEALKLAQDFAQQHPAFLKGGKMVALPSALSSATMSPKYSKTKTRSALHLFNVGENEGFIVVSADDRFLPVLGYATQGHLADGEELPDGLSYWLDFLTREMNAALEAGAEDVPFGQSQTRSASAADDAVSGATRATAESDYAVSVAPLLTTKWDQTAPYNNKIQGYATGCVATGMAQVMNYWKYPQQGVGSHTNAYHSAYSADFGSTTYDWANMRDTYGGKFDTKEEVEAVSTLMLHLGIATDMRWAKPETGSGTPNMYAGNAFINYFSYNSNLYAEQRDCLSLGAWKALIINQLQTGHPLCYAGMTGVAGSAGHFFVLDGYDAETGLFHFNWGWSGKFDGYFSITALEPGVGGTGAGTGQFNYDQQMFVNVQPTIEGEYVAHFDAKEIFPGNTSDKSKLTIEAVSLGHNSLNFKGTAGLAVYDAAGQLLQFVPSNNGLPTGGFNPGSTYSGSYGFTFDLSALTDGKYTVCLATQHESYPGKVYPIRANYTNASYFTMNVSGNAISFAEQKADFNVEDMAQPSILNPLKENTLFQNVVSIFQVRLRNSGTTVFQDEAGICIQTGKRGDSRQYITVPCTLLPGEEKTVTLSGKVLRTPGDYKLTPCYGDNGDYVVLSQSLDVTVLDEAQSLKPLSPSASAGEVYTLQGIRLGHGQRPASGLYIKGGKKYVIK